MNVTVIYYVAHSSAKEGPFNNAQMSIIATNSWLESMPVSLFNMSTNVGLWFDDSASDYEIECWMEQILSLLQGATTYRLACDTKNFQ